MFYFYEEREHKEIIQFILKVIFLLLFGGGWILKVVFGHCPNCVSRKNSKMLKTLPSKKRLRWDREQQSPVKGFIMRQNLSL